MKKGICIVLLILPLVWIQQSFAYADVLHQTADTIPDAEILLDEGSVTFVYDVRQNKFDIVYEYTRIIKINKEAAIDEWGNIEIRYNPLVRYNEKVTIIEAYTQNSNDNGEIVQHHLPKTNVYDQSISRRESALKAAMPQVQVGSIIYYTYKITSNNYLMLRSWSFQNTIPVKQSKYTMTVSPFYSYYWILQGAQDFDQYVQSVENVKRYIRSRNAGYENNTYQNTVYIFEMNDIPALALEPYISSYDNYRIRLDFQLYQIQTIDSRTIDFFTNWDQLSSTILNDKDFRGFLRAKKSHLSKYHNIDSLLKLPELERYNYAHNYVKNNFSLRGESIQPNKNIRELHQERRGNSASLNLYTISLLKILEINSRAIISSSRENGRIKYDYPFLHFFDNILIFSEIENMFIISDATKPHLHNYLIPKHLINDKGFLLEYNTKEWIDLTPAVVSETRTIIQTTIDSTGGRSNVSVNFTNYHAAIMRELYDNSTENVIQHFKTSNTEIPKESVSVVHYLDRNSPLQISFTKKYPYFTLADNIYMSAFDGFNLSENPFFAAHREMPIDFNYLSKNSLISSITIPENYSFIHLPESYSVDNNLYRCNFTVVERNKVLILRLEYEIKEVEYSPQYYKDLQEFYNLIVQYGAITIAAKKN